MNLLSNSDHFYDTKVDGNCGFRAISISQYGNEDSWPIIRLLMLEEMIVNYHLYVNSDIEYKRICFFKSPAPIDHWMSSFVYDVESNALKKPLLVLSSLLSHRISIMPNCQVDPHFNRLEKIIF